MRSRRTPYTLSVTPRPAQVFLVKVLALRPLKILHRPLVLLRRHPGRKSPQILSLTRLRIFLAGIQTILAGL